MWRAQDPHLVKESLIKLADCFNFPATAIRNCGAEEFEATANEKSYLVKGTRSPDGLGFSWHIWIDLGLKKGRGWVLHFLEARSIIHWNTHISCGKCDWKLAYKVSCLFLIIPANHRLSIMSNDKSGLAYCKCLTKRVGALPANLPSEWETRAGGRQNLSKPADQ